MKVSFQVLLKREYKDIFINDYNPKLLQNDPQNHDIQIIANEKGACPVASYIATYISKKKTGTSNLLNGIEEESAKWIQFRDIKILLYVFMDMMVCCIFKSYNRMIYNVK